MSLAGPEASYRASDVIKNINVLVTMINTRLGGVSPQPSSFTGLLLANFPKYFRPAVVTELARLVSDMGLDVWLELSHPDFLTEADGRSIDMRLIQGLVYRNGMVTISIRLSLKGRALRGVHTTGGVQSLSASVAFEVLRFLMGDKQLQILEVSLAYNLVSIGSKWGCDSRVCATHSNSTTDGQVGRPRPGVLSSFCPSWQTAKREGDWCY